MNSSLQDRLASRLGGALCMPTAVDEMSLARMRRLQLLAELVFGDAQRAQDWLHTPKKRLGGTAPMDFASDALGFEAVENWLHEIDQGHFA